jgi:hypothetical protein
MATITNVYSPEQMTTLMDAKMIASGVGITAMNQGCDLQVQNEAVALVEATTGAQYLAGLLRAIPISFYDGVGFPKKASTASAGYLRFYRIPMMIVAYTGVGSSCIVSKNATTFSTTVTGAADSISVNLTILSTISDLAAAIQAASVKYTVTVPSGMGTQLIASLNSYSGKELVGATSYLLTAGAGFMATSAYSSVTIPAGTVASVNNLQYSTTASGSIVAGFDTSAAITTSSYSTGAGTNQAAKTIDTYNGNGTLTSNIPGVQYVINDAAFSGGQDQETDAQRRIRFQTQIRGTKPGGRSTVESAVNALSWVRSSKLISSYPSPGYATVVVDNGSGGALTAPQLIDLQNVINGDPNNIVVYPGAGVAGITYQYTAPTFQYVSVSVTVTRQGAVSSTTDITTAVQTVISTYINTLSIGQSVVLTELIALAKTSHAAVYDVAFTSPTANVIAGAVTVLRNTSVSVNIATI